MNEPTTYAEVNRRVRALEASGVPKYVSASERVRMRRRVERLYKRSRELKQSVPVRDVPRLDALRDDIAAAYHIPPGHILTRRRRPAIISARRAFVVAAMSLGFSSTELAVYLRRAGAHSSVLCMRDAAGDEERNIAAVAARRDVDRDQAAGKPRPQGRGSRVEGQQSKVRQQRIEN